MFLLLKKFLKKIPLAVFLYHVYIRIYTTIEHKYNQRVFIHNGMSVLSDIHVVLHKSNFLFFVDMGTLLGIYRDGHLLKGDMDIDIGVLISDFSDIESVRNLFLSNCFRHKFIFETDKYGVIQDTYDYRGLTVDVCYYRNIESFDYCYLLYDSGDVKNLIVQLSCHHITKSREFVINSLKINIPYNVEQYLQDRYGPNWRIPDSAYKYWEGPSTKKIIGCGYCRELL